MTRPRLRWWFNFAATGDGGGIRRLLEGIRWFGDRGGALFFVHSRLRGHPALEMASGCQIVFLRQAALDRLTLSGKFLEDAAAAFGHPDVYFSFGQPLARRIGAINWVHISNALTMNQRGISLPIPTRLKTLILGAQIRASLNLADVVSAESTYCLDLVAKRCPDLAARTLVLPNGADVAALRRLKAAQTAPCTFDALAVGTYRYKRLDRTLDLFQRLGSEDPNLQRLMIIGDERPIPRAIKSHRKVECVGPVPHGEVLARLSGARVYISSSEIENSSNAALEGLELAQTSYLSDIPSHRELLLPERPPDLMEHGGRQYLIARQPLHDGPGPMPWDQVFEHMEQAVLRESH